MVKITAPELILKNATVFSSTSSSQVSTWYNEKFHSLFTYLFLKGLNYYNADVNHNRQITYRELYDYLNNPGEGVPYWARRLHGVEQSPVIQSDNLDKVLITY